MRRALILGLLMAVLPPATGVGVASDTVSFDAARPGYSWSFPRDHGSHPSYQSEWWYFTGILKSDGRTFGYQFTVFRSGIGVIPNPGSDWHTNQVFMGHLALSDVKRSNHQAFIRTERGHPELAGADTEVPGVVQIRDWQLEMENEWTIKAGHGDVELSLTLEPTRDVLFQGPGGYSKKGSLEGQASQYYSYTRMKTTGTVETAQTKHSVEGKTWFDHEFGSSQLSEQQEGWDWISLRLSNGRDLMIYRLREKNGQITPQSSATLRRPNGDVRYIPSENWELEPVKKWTSPKTGAHYPVKWKVSVDDPSISLTVDRTFDQQEMILDGALTAPYWEGMVTATGSVEGEEVSGKGYLEMTGYVSSLSGTF